MTASRLSKLAALGAAMTLPFALSACGESADTSSKPKASESGAEGGDKKASLVVASVPSEDSANLEAQFKVLGDLLKKETGMDITVQKATDYAAVIEGLRAGKIDIAMMGPFSYIVAVKKGVKLEPLGAIASAPDADPGYFSIGWVKKDSPITDINGYKGKKVCFVDVASTSGYLYPSAGLKAAGIDPEKDVKPIMAGGHDASLLSINSGQCDAGFAYEAMQDQLVDSGQLKKGDVKEVWRSEKIMGSPLAINTETVDAETVTKIKDVIATKANKPALVKDGICSDVKDCPLPEDTDYGFKKVSDSDYEGVRKVCDLTKAKACEG